MQSLKDGIGGAVFSILWWFFICSCIDGAGYKFIREPRWFVFGLCLLVPVVVLNTIWGGRRRRRQKEQFSADVANTATDLGFTYVETVERPPASLPCFTNWHTGTNGVIGEVDKVPVSLVDMTEYLNDTDCGRYPTRTIALLPADELPALTATPRWAGRFAHILGMGGMTFSATESPATEADVVRPFCLSFRIELPGNPGPLTPITPALQIADESVRRIMTPAFMTEMLQHRGWSFQTGAGWLACWHGQAVCPPNQRPQFIHTATEIRTALLAAAGEPAPETLRPRQLPSSGQFVLRAAMMFGGMLLCGYSAFFYGLFGIVPRHSPGLLVILPFALAPVAGVIGAALGYWLGAALGGIPVIARWNPTPPVAPEFQAAKNRRDSWQRGWGCLGASIGFPLGMAAVAPFNRLIWPINQNPSWGLATTLSLPILGAIVGLLVGAVIGGWIASQLEKRRSRRCAAIAIETPSVSETSVPPSNGGA